MNEPRQTPTPAQRSDWAPAQLAADDPGGRWSPHLLLLAVLVLFAFAAVWATIGELDIVTRGDGRVITTSQVQLIQNLEGGIVSHILVKEGQVVEKDQPLFRIDDTRFAGAYREGRQGTLALRARVARLTAETQRSRLEMPADVLRASRPIAQNEIDLYHTRQKDLEIRNEVLQQQLAQRQNELIELRSREARLRESFELVQKEIAISAPLVKQGVISEIELLRQQREASRLRTDLDGATLAIPRVRASIEEARKKIEDNEYSFRSLAGADLAQAKGELAKLAETIPALEDRVERTTVRSPVRGTVKLLAVRTVGGVVQPGSPLAEVVPLEDVLLVETRIRPADIAFVSVGQRAIVKITAYDYSIYGGMEGSVVLVSPDSIQPQQGEPYYIAHVRTNSAYIPFQGKNLAVIPGMTAGVDVLTGKRTVLHYLLKPVNKSLDRSLTER